MKLYKWLVVSGVLCLSLAVQAATEGISFNRTRLVFHGGDKALALVVRNHGKMPWLIKQDIKMPDGDRAPFLVTPPLFRLVGEQQNIMRIIRTPMPLPDDRESLFYYSALAIPGVSQASKAEDAPVQVEETSRLLIATRTRLKVFYRPRNLSVSVEDARKQLHFVQQVDHLLIKNSSPYYQTFAQLKFDAVSQHPELHDLMVAPYGILPFTTTQKVHQITWSVITDYGGTTPPITQQTTTQ
ncbi:molecular chaperone [Salmonella enterica]|nr:molecular chaperone [Salmonella enterica]EGM2983859.1 molecular chaperone [Salmonella enterica]